MKNFVIDKPAGFRPLNVLGMGLPWTFPEAISSILSITLIVVQELLCNGNHNFTKWDFLRNNAQGKLSEGLIHAKIPPKG